jgi:hypothetical protein
LEIPFQLQCEAQVGEARLGVGRLFQSSVAIPVLVCVKMATKMVVAMELGEREREREKLESLSGFLS